MDRLRGDERREEAPATPAPPSRPSILLVDDRADKLLAIESVLEGLGHTLVKASSGNEALRHLLREQFAVILLDVNMPGMNGFETAELIRRRPSSEHTPIIFLTAYNDTETDMSRGYALGAVDYIFTPVVPAILRAKVTVFVDLFEKSRQVRMQADLLREAAEQRAQSLERRLETLLNRLDVGVFRTDLEGRVLEANPAFRRLLNLARGSTPRMQDLFAVREDNDRLYARLVGDGQVQGAEVRLRRSDGSTFWGSLTGTVGTGADGTRFADGLLEDISLRKEAEEALIAKAAELARSNADLEQFAYIASHDLQEPLRMLSTYSSLLSTRYADALDDKAKTYLGFMVEAALRMQAMIRSILAYSRYSSHQPVFAPVDFERLLDRCVFNLDAAISERGARVTHDPLPTVPGDEALLGQLLQNLIANGIKFCDRPPPQVHVSARETPDGWEFSVADNGIGIDAQHRERIFGIFQRLHARNEFPGTGIGLAICRKVVQAHRGRIWVDSEPGRGSAFRFVLPATQAVEAHAAAAAD